MQYSTVEVTDMTVDNIWSAVGGGLKSQGFIPTNTRKLILICPKEKKSEQPPLLSSFLFYFLKRSSNQHKLCCAMLELELN